MELSIIKLVVLCSLICIGGFVDSIAGGGGLIYLPAYFLVGFPPHMATGTNKVSALMGTAVATFSYAKAGYIIWKIAIFSVCASFLGATIGAHISLMISDYYFKFILLLVLPVVAFFVMKDKDLGRQREAYSELKTILLCIPISFAVGMYDAFYGPGTGTFLILLYTTVAHLPLNNANGISKVVNLTSNVTSMIIFVINGTAIIRIGLIAGVCNMVANYIGSNTFKKDGSKIVRPVMLIVLTIFSVKIILELLGLA
jgi:uncharacterized membrane protein YfcA